MKTSILLLTIKQRRAVTLRQRGFTLIEFLIAMAVLLIISAAAFEQINQLQQKSSNEATKLDLNGEAREFIDQIVRDLHMAGYPKATMYNPIPPNTSPTMAVGLVSVSPTLIILEGDVDTSGTVSSVKIKYVLSDPNDPNCPCIQRGATPKTNASPLAQNEPVTYQVEQVYPPGTGAGQSGEDLFVFYDQTGTKLDVSAGANIGPGGDPNGLIPKIKTIKINLSLRSKYNDPVTKQPYRVSMSVTSRLN